MLLSFVTAGYVGRPALRTSQQGLMRPTRAASPCMMAGKVIVTDGSGDNFYASRTVFQMLHDFGDFSAITVRHVGASLPTAVLSPAAHLRVPCGRRQAHRLRMPRRCCCRGRSAHPRRKPFCAPGLSNSGTRARQARYSGLIDLLSFSETDFSEAVAGADTWVSINSDGAAVGAQLAAAKSAGLKRVFLHFSDDGARRPCGYGEGRWPWAGLARTPPARLTSIRAQVLPTTN